MLIVDIKWMGLQGFPNKAPLNNDFIWVKHTGKKKKKKWWFNLQDTAFPRGQLERFLTSLQRKSEQKLKAFLTWALTLASRRPGEYTVKCADTNIHSVNSHDGQKAADVSYWERDTPSRG